MKKILLRRKCLLLACFVTGLGFSKAVNAAPGDEQWDDRFGSITTPAPGALTVYQDEIYLSTHKWDGTNLIFWSKPLAYYASGAGYSDMTAIGSNLFVAGRIADPTFGVGVSRWDGANWHAMPQGITVVSDYGPYVHKLATLGGELYVSGSFSAGFGTQVSDGNGIVRWDGANWSGLGKGLNSQSSDGLGDLGVFALAVRKNILYAGGDFELAGDVTVKNLAKWDGTNWSAVDNHVFDPSFPMITALAFYNDALYLATRPYGSSAGSILTWNGTNLFNFGTVDDDVLRFAFSGTDVYIGGYFKTVNGLPVNGIARLNGTNWFALGSGLAGRFPIVSGMIIWKHDLIVSGFFDSAGGKPSKNFAIWHPVALQCAASAGLRKLSWPAFATNYVLESNIGVSPEGWTPVSPPPATNSYAVPGSGTNQFFRLRQK